MYDIIYYSIWGVFILGLIDFTWKYVQACAKAERELRRLEKRMCGNVPR